MDIKNLHQVGEKTSKILNKLGIFTDDDLINYYPYRYNVYNFSNELIDNSTLIINVIIESNPIVSYIKKNFNRLSFRARYNEKIFNVVIFNRAYLKTNLTIGKNITIIGKYDFKKNIFTSSDIKFNVTNGQIEPVYHLTKGITNNTVSKLIKDNFNNIYIKDSLPSNIISKYNLLSKKDALYNIHFPSDLKMVHYAKNRLIYEELFDFSFKMNYFKNQNIRKDKEPKNIDINKINEFKKLLPFSLTTDQDNAYNEIVQDMSSNKKMNRLLLGDVGSGKTVVAVGAIYANFIAGFESTLMAPTEVLATQHYFSIKKILDKFNVAVELITGSMSKKEKEAIYKRVQNKEIDLLIGTHSLLNENIIFNNLGLVITDEQHRFGVHQRFTLEDKSKCPDILYLSATPIPRTYAMTIYGDLDISYIKTKPTGRKDIITKVKKNSDIKGVLGLMLEQIKLGHQIYVVSPLVEEDESLNLTSINLLKEKLSLAFKNLFRIEIIHGKMKTSEKESIMNDFKNNQIKILIATTVIEVGIDVSNATMMVIFNAERFGLATLHQLRGRVGRSDLQSYCYLISDSDNDRLKVMEESNYGFYISQKDFEMRGHGDLFGTKQSGDMEFKIANLRDDYKILLQAKKDSNEYLKNKETDNDALKKELVSSINKNS